jgi:hypothetical protein
MPTIDKLISDLNGGTVFSTLDLMSAYHTLDADDVKKDGSLVAILMDIFPFISQK